MSTFSPRVTGVPGRSRVAGLRLPATSDGDGEMASATVLFIIREFVSDLIDDFSGVPQSELRSFIYDLDVALVSMGEIGFWALVDSLGIAPVPVQRFKEFAANG